MMFKFKGVYWRIIKIRSEPFKGQLLYIPEHTFNSVRVKDSKDFRSEFLKRNLQ